MKPEAQAHLDTARLSLEKARACLVASLQAPVLAEDAARDAYYVAFHAAQALIVERTGKHPRTHSGVHTQFHRIAVSEHSITLPLRAFLVKAYDFKATADYDTAPPPRISPARAASAVQSAEDFLNAVAALLVP